VSTFGPQVEREHPEWRRSGYAALRCGDCWTFPAWGVLESGPEPRI
jgi:hypothetical protein